ncbi:major facilitator superfamily domain-containing protein [Mycena latifolia]|nr:major facilitator superfamily domain-containing protein [Mycena latifolia]
MATSSTPSAQDSSLKKIEESSQAPQSRTRKPRAFWLCFVAIMVAVFLSALDLTAIGTALPTMADALNDTNGDYIWVGSAYALSSTAFIPLSGNLADVFGRKPVMLTSIGLFAVGSALAGASQNMVCIGGGGIVTLTQIIAADLVPLSERGFYQGLLSMVWCLASFIGPPVGGALSSRGTKAWRWLFYLNLPLAGLAFALVVVFLSVNRPEGSIREKLALVDWVGNALVVAGTGLAIIGLTWGGVRYPWSSAEVLAPLTISLTLLAVFVVYEAKVPNRPTIPLDVVGNRTSLSGLLTTAAHGMTSILFFQACFGASLIRSAVDFLPGSLITTPFALLAGVSIATLKKYRFVNWIGWAVAIIGYGLVSTLREDSSVGKWFSAPIFPLLAPLPNTRAASALALFAFTRSFSQTWGITISSTILQNTLEKKLPAAFVARFPPGSEIAYAAIPVIRHLDAPLRKQVQAAFADSMSAIWQTMIGIAGLGLLMSFLMAEVPMNTTVDEKYTLKENGQAVGDAETVVQPA